MIDLHLHTTASDGMLTPAKLVALAQARGVRTLSITDHDTMAGVPAAAEAAAAVGLEFLPGVEITAVSDHRDVHLLGYFLDANPPGLAPFLKEQRDQRVDRARTMAARLLDLGAPIDIDQIIESARANDCAVARPLIARALVAAGCVGNEREAFDRWIGDGKPAFVPREGASPTDVVRLISSSGGISAVAHPGLLRRDDLIPSLVKAGLTAIEVYHPEHNRATQTHYVKLAIQHQLAVSGGSDFHGEAHPKASCFGSVGLPREAFTQLLKRLLLAHSVVHGES